MSKKVAVALGLLALVTLVGCHTKPIALMETAVTELIHPDGVVSSFGMFGPWSEEFQRSWDHMQAHYRTYHNDLQALVDDYDKHFLRYDRHDPFAE
ncbi:MAG: hypothetical protein ACYTDY_02820 [Planctomycetota bacterium]